MPMDEVFPYEVDCPGCGRKAGRACNIAGPEGTVCYERLEAAPRRPYECGGAPPQAELDEESEEG